MRYHLVAPTTALSVTLGNTMTRITLNEKTARRPAPATGRMELWDAVLPGFGLRISACDARTYFVLKRLNGKLTRRTIGKHPPEHVSRGDPLQPGEIWPHEAREKARLMLVEMARGVDPAPSAATATPSVQTSLTFGEVAKAYLADPSKRGGASLRSRAELERKVRVDLAKWKETPVGDISRADVRALIKAKHAAAPVSANRLLALVRRIFRWAAREDLILANPAMDLDKPAQEEERDRVLGLSELALIWAGAEKMAYPYGRVVQLLILTAQRRNEVAGLERAEVEGANWKLPDSRAKRKKGHLVPLSPQAVALIEKLPKIGDSPLLFTTGKRAAKRGQKVDPEAPPAMVSGWSRMKKRLDKVIAEAVADVETKGANRAEERHYLSPWTLHDIRRSVATHLRDADVMADARADRITISKILNHAEGGMTRLYDRYSNDPEKRQALEAWALVVEQWGKAAEVAPATEAAS